LFVAQSALVTSSYLVPPCIDCEAVNIEEESMTTTAAWEEPELFALEMRSAFRSLS
jgi:hypothetical protein